MRTPASLLVAAASAGVLAVAWHLGTPAAGVLPGVHVSTPAVERTPAAAAPPSGGTKASGRTPVVPVRRTLDGAVVSTPYGDVQVRVTQVGGRITDVRPLHLTDANRRSVSLSAGAAPVLRREVLAAQTAQVDTVSGATYTSEGYRESLQAALDAAHA